MLCEPDMEQNFVVWAHSVCNWTRTVCKIGVEDFDTLVKFDLMFHSTENMDPFFIQMQLMEKNGLRPQRVRYSIWYP